MTAGGGHERSMSQEPGRYALWERRVARLECEWGVAGRSDLMPSIMGGFSEQGIEVLGECRGCSRWLRPTSVPSHGKRSVLICWYGSMLLCLYELFSKVRLKSTSLTSRELDITMNASWACYAHIYVYIWVVIMVSRSFLMILATPLTAYFFWQAITWLSGLSQSHTKDIWCSQYVLYRRYMAL
jgi:hypothetical protein